MRKKNLGWRAGSASNSHTGSEFKSLATKQKATTGLLCIYNPSTVRHKNRETTGICWLTAQLQVKWETLPQRNKVAGDQGGHLMFSSGLHAHTWNSFLPSCTHVHISGTQEKWSLSLVPEEWVIYLGAAEAGNYHCTWPSSFKVSTLNCEKATCIHWKACFSNCELGSFLRSAIWDMILPPSARQQQRAEVASVRQTVRCRKLCC